MYIMYVCICIIYNLCDTLQALLYNVQLQAHTLYNVCDTLQNQILKLHLTILYN